MQTSSNVGLDWLATGKNIARLEKLCARMCSTTGEDTDDMQGRAIDLLIEHGEAWAGRHDKARCTLDAWLLCCVGFMLRSRPNTIKTTKFEVVTDQMVDNRLYSIGESEPNVSDRLEKLNEYDRWLIVSRHVHNINFTTIADELGVSKGTVRTHYMRAIERCRNG
jgi:DNA-directed RNA polymerase specialized sigma24 family protein